MINLEKTCNKFNNQVKHRNYCGVLQQQYKRNKIVEREKGACFSMELLVDVCVCTGKLTQAVRASGSRDEHLGLGSL